MKPFDPAHPEDFDPLQLTRIADPYPIFAALHRTGASIQTSMGMRVVVGHDAAEKVLRDKRFASGPIAMRFRQSIPPGAAQNELGYRINFLDPPDHTRVRGVIMRAFTPVRIRDMRPWIEARAERLLDALNLRLREDPNDPINLLASFAHELPTEVISEMLGVPLADRVLLTGLSETVTPLLTPQIDPNTLQTAVDGSETFAAYAADLIAERRKNPGDDLLSAMLAADEGTERLSREELLSLVVTLYSAGHRTTRDGFSNGLFALLSHPDQYAAVVDDPNLAPRAVEEFLRYETPTLYVARVPMEEADIAGDVVGAFTPTLIFLAAANRDPHKFHNPDRFDIRRAEGSSLSFAIGPHHCLGASLARMEIEVMLRAVTRRFPKLQLATPAPKVWQSGPFRGLDALWVKPG